MRTAPTPEELSSYRENGFVVIPDLLDADELDRWREALDEAITERGTRRFGVPPTMVGLENDDREDVLTDEQAYYNNVFTQHVNLWQTNEKIRRMMFDARLGRLVADLAGVDGIRIWHDQALVKQPYANATAFHLDVPYWSFTSPDALSIWVALDDATLENGCLYYVPGSHKAKKYDNVGITKDLGFLFGIYSDWKDVAAAPCPVRAGSACVHNGLTFHGAGANMTPGLRRAMTCAYMPDGATFNGRANILPPCYLNTLELGDPLDDDRYNPLIYIRDDQPLTNLHTQGELL